MPFHSSKLTLPQLNSDSLLLLISNMDNLAETVARILQQQLPTILAHVQRITPNVATPIPPQQIISNVATPTPPQQITPNVATPTPSQATPSLSRSSSGISRSSSGVSRLSSGFSTPRSRNRSVSPQGLPPQRKSKRDSPALDLVSSESDSDEPQCLGSITPETVTKDRNKVRKPVLGRLDAKFLAPKTTPLFKRFFCKQASSDGTRKKKKNKDMDEELFKHLVRPVLRRLLGHNSWRGSNLVNRYYNAAKFVCKKRRANHVQSWRLSGKHKELIYGGSLPTPASGISDGGHVKLEPQDKPQRKRKLHLKPEPAMMVADFDSGCEAGSDNDENGNDTDTTRDYAPKHPRKTSCIDCGKRFEFNDDTEQDHADWAPGAASRHVRCPPCSDKFVANEVLPEHHGKLVNKRKPKDPDAAPPARKKSKKTRTRRTQCKCGSKTHLTARHRECPLNKNKKKNPRPASAPATPTPTPTPTPTQPVQEPTTTTTTPTPTQPVQEPTTTTSTPTQPVQEPTTTPEYEEEREDSDDNTAPAYRPPAYRLGDNVCAKWGPRKWFLSHICAIGVGANTYGVYCPVTGDKKQVPAEHVRALDGHTAQNNPTRADFVRDNVEFVYEGDKEIPEGTRWRVRRVLHEANQFVCVLVSQETGFANVDNFDIACVMRAVRDAVQESPFERRLRVNSRLRRFAGNS